MEFYGADEEIVAFDFKTGRKLDVWEPIQQARPCRTFVRSRYLSASLPLPERRFMFAGQRMLSIYRSGIPEGLTATLDGEPLWSPVELIAAEDILVRLNLSRAVAAGLGVKVFPWRSGSRRECRFANSSSEAGLCGLYLRNRILRGSKT